MFRGFRIVREYLTGSSQVDIRADLLSSITTIPWMHSEFPEYDYDERCSGVHAPFSITYDSRMSTVVLYAPGPMGCWLAKAGHDIYKLQWIGLTGYVFSFGISSKFISL